MIPGDGIGREVIPEGVRVHLEAVGGGGKTTAWNFKWLVEFPHWSSTDWYKAKHGKMCPTTGPSDLSKFDAIYFGAVGWPDRRRTTSRLGAADQVRR